MSNTKSSGGRTPRSAVAIPMLFLGILVGAWAWFHSKPVAGIGVLQFAAGEQVTGWSSREIPLGKAEKDILAASSLVNRLFTATNQPRVIAFFADWPASAGKTMNVVQHTPDMCWVDAGASIASIEAPGQVELDWGDIRIPFECRVFQMPQSERLEVAVWCTLVGGRVLAERPPTALERTADTENRTRAIAAHRRRAWEQFRQMVRDRTPGTGGKQFVRFSTELTSGVPEAVSRLKAFGQAWLEATTRHPVQP